MSLSNREDPLRRGDWVEIKGPSEILATLDGEGRLAGLPFMPEMAAFCGRRLQVDRRAERICDTIQYTGIRRLHDAVLLADLRCDGAAHGGCQAECRLFWKEAWLRRADGPGTASGQWPAEQLQALLARTSGVKKRVQAGGKDEERWVCQCTELLQASEHISLWNAGSYLREYACGNVPAGRFLKVMGRVAVQEPMRKLGMIPDVHLPGPGTWKPEDSPPLRLQPGDLVQIRSREEIAATLNPEGFNRGLWFDREMMAYCGGTYRVRQRVRKFIDERYGRLVDLKTDCYTLEGVVCSGELSLRRWFCPRDIYSYWRECWLRRADGTSGLPAGGSGAAAGCCDGTSR